MEIAGTAPKNLRFFVIFGLDRVTRQVWRSSEGAGLKRGDIRGGAAQEICFTSIMFRLKAKAYRASCSCRRNCTGNDRVKWTIPLENMVKS